MTTPVGPYTPAVRNGDLLFCSGQIGVQDGALVEGFEAQVRQAMGNLEALLSSHGSSMQSVIKTTIFITDMALYDQMNALYVESFGDHRPARSAVAAAALPKGALFEVEAIASV